MQTQLQSPSTEARPDVGFRDRGHDVLATLSTAVLREIGLPMLLLSRRAELLFTNPLGRGALRPGGVLAQHGQVVRALTREDQVELDSSLSRAGQGLRTLMLLSAGDARSRQAVAVIPIAVDDEEPSALLLLGTGPAGARLSRYLFAMRQSLTPTELQVLEQLCSGMHPLEIAKANGVAMSTVRTQISSVRAKTETSSIHTLVAFALGIPPIGPQVA